MVSGGVILVHDYFARQFKGPKNALDKVLSGEYDSMSFATIKRCPSNEAEQILCISDFVSDKQGGCGTVRDFIDWLSVNGYFAPRCYRNRYEEKRIVNKLIDLYYANRKHHYSIISWDESCKIIAEALENKNGLLAGRLGATECFALRTVEFNYFWKKKVAIQQLSRWSGFFPEDIALFPAFYDRYIAGIRNLDLAVPWSFKGEDYFFHKYCKKDVIYSQNMGIGNPIQESWLRFMEGRTLLVIHPFEATIRKQYERIDKVYPNRKIFPDSMSLKTLKAVQTIENEKDDRFDNWFEALDYMCKETDKIEFDAAVIACGAYGIPLGSYIKNSGRVACVVGGGLQSAFGIIGKRWETIEHMKELINEYWVHPSEEETPKAFKNVEGGCYW